MGAGADVCVTAPSETFVVVALGAALGADAVAALVEGVVATTRHGARWEHAAKATTIRNGPILLVIVPFRRPALPKATAGAGYFNPRVARRVWNRGLARTGSNTGEASGWAVKKAACASAAVSRFRSARAVSPSAM